jgi:hypothetical protein
MWSHQILHILSILIIITSDFGLILSYRAPSPCSPARAPITSVNSRTKIFMTPDTTCIGFGLNGVYHALEHSSSLFIGLDYKS